VFDIDESFAVGLPDSDFDRGKDRADHLVPRVDDAVVAQVSFQLSRRADEIQIERGREQTAGVCSRRHDRIESGSGGAAGAGTLADQSVHLLDNHDVVLAVEAVGPGLWSDGPMP
jgi:hypothetical protein